MSGRPLKACQGQSARICTACLQRQEQLSSASLSRWAVGGTYNQDSVKSVSDHRCWQCWMSLVPLPCPAGPATATGHHQDPSRTSFILEASQSFSSSCTDTGYAVLCRRCRPTTRLSGQPCRMTAFGRTPTTWQQSWRMRFLGQWSPAARESAMSSYCPAFPASG